MSVQWRWFLAPAALALWGFLVGSTAHAEVWGGDSIACGGGHAAGAPTMCRVGAGSCEIARKVPSGLWGWVVISAGVNDEGRCVRGVREHVGQMARVVWVVSPPRYSKARAAQLATGQAWGDRFVTYVPGKDRLHPRSYPELVRAVHATEALP